MQARSCFDDLGAPTLASGLQSTEVIKICIGKMFTICTSKTLEFACAIARQQHPQWQCQVGAV